MDSLLIIQDADSKLKVELTVSESTLVVSDTLMGPPGPRGLQGGSDFETQIHEFTNLDEWIVNHNLGMNPTVEVLSVGGVRVLTEVVYLNQNMISVKFDGIFSGRVLISGLKR